MALSLAALGGLVVQVAPALGQSSPVARLLDLINQDRAQHGLGPVGLDATLNVAAQAQAQAMATANRIFQNPSFPNNVPYANSAGENVGVGPDVDAVHVAFVASPEHQVIIVDPAFRLVGIGLANSSVGLMVVEEFVDRTLAAATAAAPPRVEAAPPPPPAPKPEPTPVAVQPVVAPKPAPVVARPVTPVAPKVVTPAVIPVVAPVPAPSPQAPPPPPPPTFDVALYSRMLEWQEWQTGSQSSH